MLPSCAHDHAGHRRQAERERRTEREFISLRTEARPKVPHKFCAPHSSRPDVNAKASQHNKLSPLSPLSRALSPLSPLSLFSLSSLSGQGLSLGERWCLLRGRALREQQPGSLEEERDLMPVTNHWLRTALCLCFWTFGSPPN